MSNLDALDILTEVAHRDAEIKEEEEQVSGFGGSRSNYAFSARSRAGVVVFRPYYRSCPNFMVLYGRATRGNPTPPTHRAALQFPARVVGSFSFAVCGPARGGMPVSFS